MLQEFVGQVKSLVADMESQMHTAIPAVIVSFDPLTCLASVLPSGKLKKPDGTMMDFPQVSGVPVVIQQMSGQDATLAYPIKEGDGCLLIISEQSLDYFLYGAESKVELKFDLTNAIAIPGLFAKPNAIVKDACEQNAIIIDKQGKRITLSKAGINIIGDVTVNGSINATGDIQAGPVSLKTHRHSGVETGSGSTGAPY